MIRQSRSVAALVGRRLKALCLVGLTLLMVVALLPASVASAATTEGSSESSSSTNDVAVDLDVEGKDPKQLEAELAEDIVVPELGRPSGRVVDAEMLENLPELSAAPESVEVPQVIKDVPVKAAQPWEADTEIIQERTATSKTFRAQEGAGAVQAEDLRRAGSLQRRQLLARD